MANKTFIMKWKKRLSSEAKNISSQSDMVERGVFGIEGAKLKERPLSIRRLFRRALSDIEPTSLHTEQRKHETSSDESNMIDEKKFIAESSVITVSKSKRQVIRRRLHRRAVSSIGSGNINTKRRQSLPCKHSSIEIDYSGCHQRFQAFEELDDATRRQLEIDIIEPLNFDYLKYRMDVLNC